MGLPMEDVVFELGDSTLPVAPIEGGSSHVTTVGSAVAGVCEKLQKRLFRLARAMPGSDFAQARFAQLRFIDGLMRWEDPVSGATRASIALSDLLSATGHERVEVRYLMLPKLLKQKRYTRATHSAVFCE